MMDRRRALMIKSAYAKPYAISYNLNGGVIQTQNPTSYTMETAEFMLNNPTRSGYTFLGWTLDDGDEYVSSSIFGSYGDRIYTAHWNMNVTQDDVSSNVFDLTIDTYADTNGDGVADRYYITLTGSSSYERINLPIKNLVVGQKYRLNFTESNNATHGNASGYYSTMYGCMISETKNNAIDGSIKETARAQGGLIAEWVGGSSGGVVLVEGSTFNGSKDMAVEFTATAETMYWIWDYGLIADGISYTYKLTDIVLNPVSPQIKFGSMALKDDDQYVASFDIIAYDEYNLSMRYTFDGESGTEILYYPITGMTVGSKYTITFNHAFRGSFINGNGGTYEYGCGILKDIQEAKLASKMSGISSAWLSNLWTMNVVSNSTESVTMTFTAPSETVYWVWNMANVSDGTIATIDLNVTAFSAAHSGGGTISYI